MKAGDPAQNLSQGDDASPGVTRARSLHRANAARHAALLALICVSGHRALGQYTAITVPPGYVQVEGDIITTESKAAALRMPGNGPSPRFVYAPSRLWPNWVVPYDYDNAVTAIQRTVFQAAMAAWERSFPGVTTISFQPRTSEAGYLHFVVADPGFIGGSTDYVGYNGGKVAITVHPNAVTFRVVVHEIGHALGLWHEQSRSDRGSYVTIIASNILSGEESQFGIQSPQSTFGDYDYASIMHYDACAFSKCVNSGVPTCLCFDPACRTIEVAAQYVAQQCAIGVQSYLSDMDQRLMAFMYGPPDWKFLYPKAGSAADGSFQEPYTTLAQAVSDLPAQAILWLGPGTYSAAGMTLSTPMTLKAAIADLQMQPNGTLGPSSSGYATLR